MEKDLEKVIAQIKQANAYEIYEIVENAMNGYRDMYPEREIMYLSVPEADITERKRIIASFIELLKEQEQI